MRYMRLCSGKHINKIYASYLLMVSNDRFFSSAKQIYAASALIRYDEYIADFIPR